MEVPSYFTDFLQKIRPTEEQKGALSAGHIELREWLAGYEPLKPVFVTTFLQGSYRRSTALRPAPKRRSDVDIVVVTKLHESEYTPDKALDLFRPFVEKYYKGHYRIQGRSIGISKPAADLDLVVTSAPPERVMGILPEEEESDAPLEDETPEQQRKKDASAKTWKDVALRIPDRGAKRWVPTHPLTQLAWTRQKNAATNGNFVNVVKAIKWWKYNQHHDVEQPKGYPLERLIGACCPNGVRSVAEGVAKTLESFRQRYPGGKPELSDYGSHPDVLHRITREEFHEFYGIVARAAKLARRALDEESLEESVKLWQELFGDRFPGPPPPKDGGDGGPKGGFSPRTSQTVPGSGRFA